MGTLWTFCIAILVTIQWIGGLLWTTWLMELGGCPFSGRCEAKKARQQPEMDVSCGCYLKIDAALSAYCRGLLAIYLHHRWQAILSVCSTHRVCWHGGLLGNLSD